MLFDCGFPSENDNCNCTQSNKFINLIVGSFFCEVLNCANHARGCELTKFNSD